ncbi:MAG: D-alanine--D-alanine ligase [bacterium]|nr:D-alanine--D-alanine ligase [Mycoplasmatota bacterium]MDD6757753.1 D-alanine--D-alanine ligase [bacterium]
MKIKVGVIFGGESVEHEVSVISAMQAMNKLDQEKYEIIPIYITKDREWYTGEMLKDIEVYQDLSLIKKYGKNVVLYYRDGSFVLQKKSFPRTIVGEVDIVLPVVHGTNVEDGGLQGYLQTIGVPFVGSDVYASVVGQDKVFMKDIWKNAKLPMTDYVWFYDIDYKQDRDEVIKKVEKLSYPVIVKPATTGSSVGIAVCGNREELVSAIDDAIQYDKKILVEEVVQNLKEVNIAVMGNYEHQKVSEIEEVLSANKFLTYADKYIGDGKGKLKGVKAPVKGASKGMASANRKLPAELSEKVRKEVEDVAREAFRALGSSGNSRIDFLVDEKTNKVYINEINSIPGSLAFYLWEAKEIDFSTVLDEMINIGVKDYKKRVSKTHSFETNILQGFAAHGGVKGLKGMKGKLR